MLPVPIQPAYRYRAALLRVIDGDTLELDVDLGFSCHYRATVRLRGLNCPEIGTEAGQAAYRWLMDWVGRGQMVVETVKPDKYGGRRDLVGDHGFGPLPSHGFATPAVTSASLRCAPSLSR